MDEDFGTPGDFAVNADGEIFLLYDSRGGSLKLARFNKEWVEAGESKGQGLLVGWVRPQRRWKRKRYLIVLHRYSVFWKFFESRASMVL